MRGHSGDEIPEHAPGMCICWALGSTWMCTCECHEEEA